MELLTDILHRYGALVVFGVVFAEQLGLPFPALPLLVAAGVLIGTGHLAWSMVCAAAIVATLLADGLWYAAGQWRGRSVLTVLCRIALEPASCIRRTETFFLRHGAPALVASKFIPGLSTIAPPLAGIMGLSLSAFLWYDGLGTLLWVGSSLGAGYLFSDQIEQALVYVEQGAPVVILAVAGGVVGYMLYNVVAARRLLGLAPRITVDELLHAREGEQAPLLVDVRSHAAVMAEPGVPGAMHLPLEELEHRHGTLPRDRDLVLYCACPGDVSSAQATLRPRRFGFERVRVLRGGLGAWQTKTRPYVTAESVSMASMPS